MESVNMRRKILSEFIDFLLTQGMMTRHMSCKDPAYTVDRIHSWFMRLNSMIRFYVNYEGTVPEFSVNNVSMVLATWPLPAGYLEKATEELRRLILGVFRLDAKYYWNCIDPHLKELRLRSLFMDFPTKRLIITLVSGTDDDVTLVITTPVDATLLENQENA